MNALKRPATMGDVLSFAEVSARATGILVALALNQVDPEGAKKLASALGDLLATNPIKNDDTGMFLDQAYVGVETVLYDLAASDDKD